MGTVECSHCKGTGKEWASMSLDTGEVQYRTCSVCNGTGSVAAEKSHFTEYPDLSLQKALQLMQRHGKPVEICIAGDHDIRVLFEDGSRYILGGFTVGYRGTGPDYTERLLNAAGFNISIDEIAEMKPPVTLVAGQPYVAPKTLAFSAPTIEEAKKTAQKSIPSDAKIIAYEVVCDGTTLRTVEGVGVSEDAAFQIANRCLPEGAVLEQKNVRDEFRHLRGKDSSEEEALQKAKQGLPKGVAIEQKKVLQPESQGEVTVEAFSKEEAKVRAENQLPMGAALKSIHCTREPRFRSGFLALLGIGKDERGIYTATWRQPCEVMVTYRVKKVILSYRPKAVVKVRFQPSSN